MIIEKIEYRPIRFIVLKEDLSPDIEKTRNKLYNIPTPKIMEYLRKQHQKGDLLYHTAYQEMNEYSDIITIVKRKWKDKKSYEKWSKFKSFIEYKKMLEEDAKYEIKEIITEIDKIAEELEKRGYEKRKKELEPKGYEKDK